MQAPGWWSRLVNEENQSWFFSVFENAIVLHFLMVGIAWKIKSKKDVNCQEPKQEHQQQRGAFNSVSIINHYFCQNGNMKTELSH